MLNNITPVILTYNEQENIERTLSALQWAKNIIIVDSFSDDNTLSICKRFENVTVIQRTFDQHAKQWNFAIQQNISTEWILALDADHIVSDKLFVELSELKPAKDIAGYWVKYTYLINGKALTGSLYPPLIALYKKQYASYVQDGHTQRLKLEHKTDELTQNLLHDDRKSHKRWLNSQKKYAEQEANKLSATAWSELSINDKIRCIPMLAPLLVLPYTLVIKRTLLDGYVGLIYTYQRFTAELILQIARLRKLFKL